MKTSVKKVLLASLIILFLVGTSFLQKGFEGQAQSDAPFITAELKQAPQPKPLKPSPTPVQPVLPASRITVTYPVGGEVWQTANSYQIRWTSTGISGNVKLVLLSVSNPGESSVIVENWSNSGAYLYTVPLGTSYRGTSFKVAVMTMDGKVKDESDRPFTIESEIDLSVNIEGLRRTRKTLEFTISFQNKGTQFLNQVLFDWILIWGTSNTVYKQDGAGYSNVYPKTRYSVPISICLASPDCDSSTYAAPVESTPFILEVIIDPRNFWNESNLTKGDNKVRKEIGRR